MTESTPSGTSEDPTGECLQRIKHSALLTRLLLGDVYSRGSQASIHTLGQYPGQTGVHIVLLYNPLKNQSKLHEYLTDRDLSLTAYSPLAHGDLVGDEMLADIGSAYGKTAPQVAIRWLVQQERVIVIPKATSQAHIESNLDVFDFELTDREMQRIRDRTPGLRRRLRNRLPSVMRRLPV
jgi:aryl-alcohol dehydrogenase-like predicted oxidoreductase